LIQNKKTLARQRPGTGVGGRGVGIEGQGTSVEGRGTCSGVDWLSGVGVEGWGAGIVAVYRLGGVALMAAGGSLGGVTSRAGGAGRCSARTEVAPTRRR
jgi:hypothetical protein